MLQKLTFSSHFFPELSSTGTILEWGECMADCPKEDVTAVCVMEPGDNFTNILRAAFLYKCLLSSFSVLTFQVCKLLAHEIGAKAARKILVKLTPGDNFTNILRRAAFLYDRTLPSFSALTIGVRNLLLKS